MINFPKGSNLVSPLAPLMVALALTSCGTKPDPAGAENPSRSGDPNSIRTVMARFAKAAHEVADLNENGEATIGELKRVSKKMDDVKFKIYDEDNSGGLSVAEAIKAVETGDVSAKLKRQFDPNGDGIVDPAEMARFNKLIGTTDGLRNFIQVEHVFAL